MFGCFKKKPENRRYYKRMMIAMAVYLVSLFASEWLIEDRGLSGLPAYALAIVPGLAVASIIWIVGRLIVEESDEFIRMLIVRQSLIATGFAFTLAAIWGFLEQYMLVDHLAAYWWPILWCFGLGIGAISNKISHGASGAIL